MSHYKVSITWQRKAGNISFEEYDRDHTWSCEGGAIIQATASTELFGNPSFVNPQEAFLAAVSSSHMLEFLALAADNRLLVESYFDEAVGFMEDDEDGNPYISCIYLRPQVIFRSSTMPEHQFVNELHEMAKQASEIISSIKTQVLITERDHITDEPAGENYDF